MMALLRRKGSIHAIDGKYTNNTSDSGKEKIERDALSVIQLSLAPNILCEVSTSTDETDKVLWKRLERLYQDRSMTTRMLLQRRLHTFKMDSGDKGDEASELFVKGRTSQQGRSKSKYRSKSCVNKKTMKCWGYHKKGHFERDCPMSKSKEKASAS
ncbi:hypothetical protein H5410_001587, partial [Solanum commersonii]